MAPNSESPKAQGKDAIRRFNLSAALTVIHDVGPITRTQLIRTLRLSRTTVFELVGQLSQLGLVTEADPTEVLGVGRPSLVVSASDQVGAIAVNPESDAITVGLVTFGGKVPHKIREISPTLLDPESTADVATRLIAEIRSRLSPDFRIVGAGVAVPGQVSRETGQVLLAPRLGWIDTDFREMLRAKISMPVWLDNNARLVTKAEQRSGAARGFGDFIYIFGGAGGIGGGIVTDNRVLLGKTGFAGELGHMRISDGSAEDFGGLNGTFEALVKRDDFLIEFRRTDLTDVELDHLIQSSQSEAFRRLAARQIRLLAFAMGNLANIFDPELVVLGGFLGSLYRRFPDLLHAGLAEAVLPGILRSLVIRPSSDISDPVLLGAAELVFSSIVADPMSFGIAAQAANDAHVGASAGHGRT